MKGYTIQFFLTALFAGILLTQYAKGDVEISTELFNEIIEELSSIVYGIPVFEKTTCSDVDNKKLYYYLYTHENIENGTRLYPDRHDNNFDPSLETKFITHGWMGKVNGSWAVDIKDAYLKMGNYNVILLDWSKYATNRYSKSACYVTKVANATARLIVQLKNDSNLDLNKTHLIGHSLGGQMAGIIGQFIQNFTNGEKVKRVTGLDAAGPLFCHPNVGNDDERITSDDAQFVDGIHTNDGQFGCSIEYGQSNFYPNCGKRQSGCSKVTVSLKNITDSFKELFSKVTCSHARSHQYWIESILENSFSSKFCSSCTYFQMKLCSSNSDNNMGEYCSLSETGNYYLKTNSKSPYGNAKGNFISIF